MNPAEPLPEAKRALSENEDGAPEVAAPAPAATRVLRQARNRPFIFVIAVVAIVAALHWAKDFFIPLTIGILLTYALRPVVDSIVAGHIPRAAAAAVVTFGLLGGGGWAAYALSDDATALLDRLPEAARKVRIAVSVARAQGTSSLHKVQEAAKELDAAASGGPKPAAAQEAPLASRLRDYLLAQTKRLVNFSGQALLVLLLVYFLLASGDLFRRKFVRVIGSTLSHKKVTVRILEDIDEQVQRYMLVTLVCNVLLGVLTWLAFRALGVEQAALWGVVAGVLHFIPYLGPATVAVASTIAAFLQFGTVVQAFLVGGASLAVAIFVGMGVMTWMQSRMAHMNQPALFIGLLFFAWLWGVWGLLLGAPLIAIVKVICDHIEPLQPIAEMLGVEEERENAVAAPRH
jgi:predicted PurR-regulated permease PerM